MEKYSFFNDVDNDRVYYAEDFARHLAQYFTNGVFNNGCLVLANNENMSINVSSGSANINGYRYDNDSTKVLTIDNADGVLNRIDNIVIRLDLTNRTITSQVVKGTFADNPTAPALVRTSTTYDLRIAKINIPAGTTTITQDLVEDTRFITSDCGNVICAVQTPDTEQLFIQIQAEFEKELNKMKSALTKFNTDSDNLLTSSENAIDTLVEESETAFNNMIQTDTQTFNTKMSEYNTTFTNKINSYDNTFNTKIGLWTDNFDAWFNNLKDKLDGNTATKLQNEIDEINNKDLVEDANYVHTDNNYSNVEKQKVATATTDIQTLKNMSLNVYETTLVVDNWQLDTDKSVYIYNVVNSSITANTKIDGCFDLLNQRKLKDGEVNSYDGGFKISTSEMPEEDINVTIYYQLANLIIGGNE